MTQQTVTVDYFFLQLVKKISGTFVEPGSSLPNLQKPQIFFMPSQIFPFQALPF
jgi:hypothetical protein